MFIGDGNAKRAFRNSFRIGFLSQAMDSTRHRVAHDKQSPRAWRNEGEHVFRLLYGLGASWIILTRSTTSSAHLTQATIVRRSPVASR